MSEPDPELFFFLSFAESDGEEEDGLVRTFFHRLRHEVRAAAGLARNAPAPTGFLSTASLRLGADWSREIGEALGTCAVFVALTAPRYFNSRSCGREWRAFAERQEQYRRRAGRTPPVLLPVTWRPTPVHPVVAPIQFADRELSETVHERGLFAVAQQDRYRNDYHAFVTALGSVIVRLAREYRVPVARPGTDFDHLPYAFPEDPARTLENPESPEAPPAPPREGPRPAPAPPRPRLDSDFPHLPGV